MVNKARLIENMADLVKDKRIEGITGLNDETNRKGMRLSLIHILQRAAAELCQQRQHPGRRHPRRGLQVQPDPRVQRLRPQPRPAEGLSLIHLSRRARLRCTAWPIFLVAVRPTRVRLPRVLSTYSTRAVSYTHLATGVTMARSNPASRFSKVDLPALGRPTMAQSTPCLVYTARCV